MKRFVGTMVALCFVSLTYGQEPSPLQAPEQQIQKEPVQKDPVQSVPIQKDEPTQKEEPVQKPEWTPSPAQKRLHDLHANVRQRRGLFVQRLDPTLCGLAQRWAERMASVGRMYHSSMGYRENVAWGYPTCEAAMNAWVNSGGHYSNLISGSEACGFGAARGRGGWYWCSLHGGPSSQETTVTVSTGGGNRYQGRSIWRPFGGRFRRR